MKTCSVAEVGYLRILVTHAPYTCFLTRVYRGGGGSFGNTRSCTGSKLGLGSHTQPLALAASRKDLGSLHRSPFSQLFSIAFFNIPVSGQAIIDPPSTLICSQLLCVLYVLCVLLNAFTTKSTHDLLSEVLRKPCKGLQYTQDCSLRLAVAVWGLIFLTRA